MSDLRNLIQQTRKGAGEAGNSALVLLCWHIGRRVGTVSLKEMPSTSAWPPRFRVE